MIIVECEQGSPEWHQARAGCITASMFKVARKRLKSGANKGEFTEEAKNYAFRLAVERISGTPLDEGFQTWQMKRGHELEPEAQAVPTSSATVSPAPSTCAFNVAISPASITGWVRSGAGSCQIRSSAGTNGPR